VGDKRSHISGGQKQRVAIVRVILCQPNLLLDEGGEGTTIAENFVKNRCASWLSGYSSSEQSPISKNSGGRLSWVVCMLQLKWTSIREFSQHSSFDLNEYHILFFRMHWVDADGGDLADRTRN
jgi:hypothetical protein